MIYKNATKKEVKIHTATISIFPKHNLPNLKKEEDQDLLRIYQNIKDKKLENPSIFVELLLFDSVLEKEDQIRIQYTIEDLFHLNFIKNYKKTWLIKIHHY